VRAVVCRELGSPADIVVEERPPPRAGAGQVVVAVRAAGVNYVDGLVSQGRYQMRFATPYVPGGELSGEVLALGEGVRGLDVGQPVMALSGLGAFAEQVAVDAARVVPLPSGLSYPQAAAFIQSYSTAFFALSRRASLAAGEWVLVLGAGGGVGLAAVDVSLALGARVVAAASSGPKLARAAELGAEGAIDYETEDLKRRARELSGGGVDVVVDPVGGRHSEPALRASRALGRFCVIGFAAGSIASVALNVVLLNNRTVIGVDWGAWAFSHPEANRALLDELVQLVAAGRLHPVEPAQRPLEDAPAVMAGLLERSVSGKVVLVP
jgi:NADPH2:quinone reductase